MDTDEFKTRMFRHWKDFLWMGHIVISASKKRPVTVEDRYYQHLCEQKG